jgi:hypothetical protein
MAKKRAELNEKLRAYMARYLRSAAQEGRAELDKEVQRHFADDHIKVCWNVLKHQWEIWYVTSGDIYCVHSYRQGEEVTPSRVICQLQTVQRGNGRRMLEFFEKQSAAHEREIERRIDDAAREMANWLHHAANSRCINTPD